MTRRGCVLGLLAWATLMALPICALMVAIRGEVAWQRGPFTADRIWLVRADEGSRGERSGGLAYSSMRLSSGRPGDGGTVCARTNVYFWMWRGENETLTFCECYQATPAGDYESSGECQ